MCLTSDDGSQNMFVYQSKPDMLELKEEKGADYVLRWKSERVYTSKLKPLYTDFLHSIKLSGYRVEIKYNRDSVAVEQNNYITKIANAYIVYDLDACPKNPTNSFQFKDYLFRATNIVKSSDKEKWAYIGYGITFDNAGPWTSNDFAKNVIHFGVDNSSSSHTNNRINNILMLGKGPTYGINESVGSSEEKFSINFSKANTKF